MSGDTTTPVAVVATGDAATTVALVQALADGGVEGVTVVTDLADAGDMFAPAPGEGQPIPASIQGLILDRPRIGPFVAESLNGLTVEDEAFFAGEYRPELRVKRLHPLATLPQYQSKGAAAFDLHAVITEDEESPPGTGITIPVGQARTFKIGLAFEVPDGWVMKVYSRSGHGFKHGIVLANGTGIIDCDYTGQMFVRLRNEGDFPFTVHHSDRVAQCMLEPSQQWELVEIPEGEDIKVTERGDGAFGSTGR